jgi:hypothetical protein
MLHETGTTMPTRFETDLLIAHAHLVSVIQAWTEENATGAATTRSVPLEDLAGPGVEVTPKNSRAAKAYFRLETPTNVVVHLGRNSWWDDLALDDGMMRSILDAVSRGRFRETVRVSRGRVMTSHGVLELNEQTWHARQWGIPIGRRVIHRYEPFVTDDVSSASGS